MLLALSLCRTLVQEKPLESFGTLLPLRGPLGALLLLGNLLLLFYQFLGGTLLNDVSHELDS